MYSPAMQSGKSEVAKYLCASRGYTRVSFAAPIKLMLLSLLSGIYGSPLAHDMVWGHLKSEPMPGFGAVTPRHMMQTMGTEWGRNAVDQNLWVKAALSSMRNPGGHYVIDDLRFHNEYNALREEGAQVWCIHRLGAVVENGHKSEGLLDYALFDAKITNNGTIEQLFKKVSAIMYRGAH